MAAYDRALAAYTKARAAYDLADKVYWNAIQRKRKIRVAKLAHGEPILLDDYVLTQPPVYAGPARPVNPSVPPKRVSPPYVPIVADFLNAAKREFDFVPQKPRNEREFKNAYAAAALAAGLTPHQAVRTYAFEATGNGTYDVQAGLETNSPKAHAITTALGYNQLLTTNSVEALAEAGNRFINVLSARSKRLTGKARDTLEAKIAILRTMMRFARSVPDDWSQLEVLASSPKGLAIQALNLDVDIGPLLQAQDLATSVAFARRHGRTEALDAAELEMMNLTGDGNGFDMITLSPDWQSKVPTANFFQESGYLDNPVAQRNNVVSRLLAATNAQMDVEAQKPGARDLATAFARSVGATSPDIGQPD